MGGDVLTEGEWEKGKKIALFLLGLFLVGKASVLGENSFLAWILLLPGAFILSMLGGLFFMDYERSKKEEREKLIRSVKEQTRREVEREIASRKD